MLSYLKDTNAVEVYDGANWVASDDPNAIQNTIVDAKGDLITATGADTPARLAVGSNGDTLVADSAATTGLRWTENYAAGKNKIINGDFFVNQRAFSSTTTDGTYGFDRFKLVAGSGATMSAQTFTPGTAPVSGYEARNFCRIVTTGQSGASVYSMFEQDIEDVRTFAGQTITISFWAKAASSTPKIATQIFQQFGSGGSPSAVVETYVGQSTLSTSWARYSVSVAVPSISGKTIGTTANTSYFGVRFWVSAGTDNNAQTGSLGIQSNTFDIWGIQAEEGSVATAFQTATGTIQGELAACQRYYYTHALGNSLAVGLGTMEQASLLIVNVKFPVNMRTSATLVSVSGTNFYGFERNFAVDSFNSFTILNPGTTNVFIYNNTEVSGTVGNSGRVTTQDATSLVAFSAEL
jgi:hypothetical protein